jgi:hypothetical protein
MAMGFRLRHSSMRFGFSHPDQENRLGLIGEAQLAAPRVGENKRSALASMLPSHLPHSQT